MLKFKKVFALVLALAMTLSVFASTTAFASEGERISTDDVIVIDVPFKPGETTTVIDGDFMFVIRDSVNDRARGTLYAYRDIDVYDLVQTKVWHGTVHMYAGGVYDGKVLGITSSGAYITEKPSTSDLKITSTTVTGNNSQEVQVQTRVTCTGTNGNPLTGIFTMYCFGNGNWF